VSVLTKKKKIEAEKKKAVGESERNTTYFKVEEGGAIPSLSLIKKDTPGQARTGEKKQNKGVLWVGKYLRSRKRGLTGREWGFLFVVVGEAEKGSGRKKRKVKGKKKH